MFTYILSTFNRISLQLWRSRKKSEWWKETGDTIPTMSRANRDSAIDHFLNPWIPTFAGMTRFCSLGIRSIVFFHWIILIYISQNRQYIFDKRYKGRVWNPSLQLGMWHDVQPGLPSPINREVSRMALVSADWSEEKSGNIGQTSRGELCNM